MAPPTKNDATGGGGGAGGGGAGQLSTTTMVKTTKHRRTRPRSTYHDVWRQLATAVHQALAPVIAANAASGREGPQQQRGVIALRSNHQNAYVLQRRLVDAVATKIGLRVVDLGKQCQRLLLQQQQQQQQKCSQDSDVATGADAGVGAAGARGAGAALQLAKCIVQASLAPKAAPIVVFATLRRVVDPLAAAQIACLADIARISKKTDGVGGAGGAGNGDGATPTHRRMVVIVGLEPPSVGGAASAAGPGAKRGSDGVSEASRRLHGHGRSGLIPRMANGVSPRALSGIRMHLQRLLCPSQTVIINVAPDRRSVTTGGAARDAAAAAAAAAPVPAAAVVARVAPVTATSANVPLVRAKRVRQDHDQKGKKIGRAHV